MVVIGCRACILTVVPSTFQGILLIAQHGQVFSGAGAALRTAAEQGLYNFDIGACLHSSEAR